MSKRHSYFLNVTQVKNCSPNQYLVFKALVHAKSLSTKLVSDSEMTHEIRQVDGPHALRQLQLPAGTLEVWLTDGVKVPANPTTSTPTVHPRG